MVLDYRSKIENIMCIRCPRTKEKDKVTPWRFIDHRVTDYSIEFAYRIPNGYSYLDIEKQIDSISAAIGSFVEVTNRGGAVVISIITKDLPEIIKYNQQSLNDGSKLFLGYGRNGDPVYSSSINNHMLLSAASGYGKTDALRLYSHLLKLQDPKTEIDIIDMKGCSYLPWEQIGIRVVYEIEEAVKILKEAYLTMKERIQHIRKSGNREACKDLPLKVIIVDEYAELSPKIVVDPEEKKLAQEATRYISSLIRIGREIKCAVWLCTQYPTNEVIHNQIKSNMINVVSLKLEKKVESETVLGSDDAFRLPSIPGRAYVKGKGVIQIPYVGDDKAWEKLLKPFRSVTHDKETGESEYDNVITQSNSDYRLPYGQQILSWSGFPTQASVRSIDGSRKTEINRGTAKKYWIHQTMETHQKREGGHWGNVSS